VKTSCVTTKGQVTIPAEVRKKLGIHQGDRVGFVYEDGKVIILPVIKDIEAAFGLVAAGQTENPDFNPAMVVAVQTEE